MMRKSFVTFQRNGKMEKSMLMSSQRCAFETKFKALVNKLLDGSQPILVRIKVFSFVFDINVANKSCLVKSCRKYTSYNRFEEFWRSKEEITSQNKQTWLRPYHRARTVLMSTVNFPVSLTIISTTTKDFRLRRRWMVRSEQNDPDRTRRPYRLAIETSPSGANFWRINRNLQTAAAELTRVKP